MKRVAIILGSPFPQNSSGHLRGVSADVDNYKKFLMSSDGGAWTADEIHVGIHIGKSAVPKIQVLCKDADIAYVIYTGHGFMRRGENYLNINTRESLNLSNLYTTAKRQITIIDACRTNYPYEHFEGIAGISLEFDNTRRDISRALYDECVARSPWGRYTMYSCSPNESSQDTQDGGRFTVSLLENIKTWSTRTDKFHLTAYGAASMAYTQLKRENAPQTPTHSYTGTTIPDFPFTISTRAYIKVHGRQTPVQRSAQVLSQPKLQSRETNNAAARMLTVVLVGTILLSVFGE